MDDLGNNFIIQDLISGCIKKEEKK